MTDHDEVRSLIARVAHTADSAADVDDNITLYTPDAVWAMGATTVTGHEQLRTNANKRRQDGVAGPGTASRHLISTVAVSIDGDTATADSYWQFFTSTTTVPTLTSMGAYRDTVVRTDAGWRIARREITSG